MVRVYRARIWLELTLFLQERSSSGHFVSSLSSLPFHLQEAWLHRRANWHELPRDRTWHDHRYLFPAILDTVSWRLPFTQRVLTSTLR